VKVAVEFGVVHRLLRRRRGIGRGEVDGWTLRRWIAGSSSDPRAPRTLAAFFLAVPLHGVGPQPWMVGRALPGDLRTAWSVAFWAATSS
jgi:hypothetical protein